MQRSADEEELGGEGGAALEMIGGESGAALERRSGLEKLAGGLRASISSSVASASAPDMVGGEGGTTYRLGISSPNAIAFVPSGGKKDGWPACMPIFS